MWYSMVACLKSRNFAVWFMLGYWINRGDYILSERVGHKGAISVRIQNLKV